MAVNDNLGGGLKVNGYDVTLPLASGQSVDKGDLLYMQSTAPLLASTYLTVNDSDVSGQTYTNPKIKLIPNGTGYYGLYFKVLNGYMHLCAVYMKPPESKCKGSIKMLSLYSTTSTKPLNISVINYVKGSGRLIIWFVANGYNLYMMSLDNDGNNASFSKNAVYNLLGSNVAGSIPNVSVTSFAPTQASIYGSTVNNNKLCFHICRSRTSGSAYKGFELLAFDVNTLTFSSITCYRTCSYSQSTFAGNIKGSGINVVCYYREGNYSKSSTNNGDNTYDVSPPAICMYMADPAKPTEYYARANLLGSCGTTTSSNWPGEFDNENRLSSNYIHSIVTFNSSNFSILLPEAYSPYNNDKYTGTKMAREYYTVGYSTHNVSHSSSSDMGYAGTLVDKYAEEYSDSGAQTIMARFRLPLNKFIMFSYCQTALHDTTITIKSISIPSNLIRDTAMKVSTANAYYTAKHGLELLTYNDEECFFIDTKGNHLIIVRNPIQLYKYNISSHTINAPIGIAKHTATDGKRVTFRNFVL